MSYENGNATDFLDLLDKVKALAVTEGWTVQRETYDALADTDGELILDGPGLGDDQNIIVAVKTYRNTDLDHFNWELKGARDFNGEAWASLPQQSPSRWLPLWDDTITYWLIVNKQRIAMVAKVSTVYMHLYLGYIDSYASDAEYDYPLLIGGSGTMQVERWSASAVAAYWDITAAGNELRGALWAPALAGTTSISQGNWIYLGTNSGAVKVWPWEVATSIMDDVRDSYGTYPLLPAVVHVNFNSNISGALGELDGVRYTTGFSLGTEDIIQVGAQDHLVAQDAYRNNVFNFCALELA